MILVSIREHARRALLAALAAVAVCASAAPAGAQLQEVFVPSNATWTVSDESGGSLGNARLVCLRPDQPASCPSGALSWDYPGIGSYAWYQNLRAIPNGRYIWAPGLTPQSINVNTFYYFRKTVTLNAPPQSGNFFITADDYAEVRINGTLVGTVGSLACCGGPRPLRSFNILPFLRQGANDFEIKAKNADYPDFPCACATYGENPAGVVFGGRLTAGSGTAPVPGAPGNFQARTNGNDVELTWDPPATGGTVSGYTIVARATPGGPITIAFPVGDVQQVPARGPNGTFVLAVRAEGPSGVGPESSSVTVTLPVTPQAPGAPTNLAVTAYGSGVTLAWTPPTSGGLPSRYVLTVQAPSIGTVAVPLAANLTGTTFAGVPPGTYTARLAAENAGGVSGPSNQITFTVAPPAPPGTPTLAAPQLVGRRLDLSWTPGTGGVPVDYVLVAAVSPGGAPVATLSVGGGTSVSLDLPAGVSGTFFLRLSARNALGSSGLSNEVSVLVP